MILLEYTHFSNVCSEQNESVIGRRETTLLIERVLVSPDYTSGQTKKKISSKLKVEFILIDCVSIIGSVKIIQTSLNSKQ